MTGRIVAAGLVLVAGLLAGCSAASRHKVLTTLFDGVPPIPAHEAAAGVPGAPAATSSGRPGAGSEHGPYAAKLCNACHDPGGMNGLVAQKDQLCFRCHAMPLDARYVHGPMAAGGCLLCHDPHDSRYPELLVSDTGSFCVRCHDPAGIAAVEAHRDLDPGTSCTTCHDAHGSDKPFLLK